MKLAWKELKYNKSKYFMVEAIVILLIFMVLFLSGLANGLKRAVSASIDNMDTAYFAVSDDAEEMLTRSNVSTEPKEEIEGMTDGETATLNIQRMNITKEGEEAKMDITYFAVEEASFLLPKVSQGESISFDGTNEIILNDSFQEEGIAIGDQITDASSGITMVVAGFSHGEYYGHSSVGFISKDTYNAIREALSPTTLHVVIKDNGMGIAEDKLERIFEKFYQCEESHKKQGTGLGLSIVKRILELLCGEIRCESEEGIAFLYRINS